MKTILILATSVGLTSCSVAFNPDGSKSVTLDAIAAAGIIHQIIASK
jgi:hypothetical protein